MASFNRAIITNKGRALIAKSLINTDIKFTKICISEKDYSTVRDLENIISIENVKQTELVSEANVLNNSTVQVIAPFTNTLITTGYYLRTIGLYANDPDEGEILYSITAAIMYDWIPPFSSISVTSFEIKLSTVISNANNLDLTINPEAVVNISQFKEFKEQVVSQLSENMKKTGDLNELVTSNNIVQKKLMEAFFGFNNGIVDTSLFKGSSSAPQGMAYLNVKGIEKVFIRINTVSPTWEETRCRIVEFNLLDNGGISTAISFSEELNLGHQSLKASIENGEIYLYSTIPSIGSFVGNNIGKGYSKIHWKGNSTTQNDVTSYQLFGLVDSGHIYQDYYSATVTLSSDNKYLIMSSPSMKQGIAKVIFVYDKSILDNSNDLLSVQPISVFQLINSNFEYGNIQQDLACDGKFIYNLRGYTNPFATHSIQVYDLMGNLVRTIEFDDIRAEYGKEGLLNNPTLGTPITFEPEGIDIRNDELIVLISENWNLNADIISYKGKNYSATTSSTNKPPSDGQYWVKTNKAPTMGEWNSATTYSSGGGINKASRRSKNIFAIGVSKNETNEKPINNGLTDRKSLGKISLDYNDIITYPKGSSFKINAFSERSQEYKNSLEKTTNMLKIFDERETSDNTKFFNINANYTPDRQFVEIRSNDVLASGSGINMYGKDDSLVPGVVSITPSIGGTTLGFNFNPNGTLTPTSDNTHELGATNKRWKDLYVGTGTINTSDRNYKQQISNISDAVLDAWSEVNYHQFKFNDSVLTKGENARWHIGVIAQDIKEIFEKHNLDATDYGLLCYSQWEYKPPVYDEEGNLLCDEIKKGNMWSIRADECQFLEMALIRRELNKLKSI